MSNNISNSSQGAIQQKPTNNPTYPIVNPINLSNLDLFDNQSIQLTNPTIQQQRDGKQQQQPIFELDITPDEEEEEVSELSEKEVAEIRASASKFPVAEFIRVVGRIKSVSNMISAGRKSGASDKRLAQLKEERKELKVQKVAAEKALEAVGLSAKDIKEGNA